MGVLNVTPDSFSDGGRWLDADQALAHGRLLRRQGADVLDVGGESTRPGSERVPVDVELARVLPVVRALAADGAVVSIDTVHAETADACLRAGAAVVNDVSGGLADPEILDVAARHGARYVLGHWRGDPATMNERAVYADVVAEVVTELAARTRVALAAGVDPALLVLDPGLGFAKDAEHNWELLARLEALEALGHPLLVGASRKRFLGALLAGPDGVPAPPLARDGATAALTAILAARGVWGVRVHEVRPSADAVRVAAALRAAGRAR
ncbi:dihydropteroate synthase [Georgenia wutianyii]|uniref:dihydropteroate synthase n=2 Tax=Georgenia wutianyii TaxID=2585135 RepID=A0ABX5VSD2_9MICO|nr:dihydropteroate synthase [Georgenia wutianyii]QDB80856.1 dihydropteroate synthase [Georgenia wutianyii]